MNKRVIALLVLTVFTLHVFTGCGDSGIVMNYEDSDKETVTLSFFGNKYEPENVKVIEEIISGFMEENPNIRVSYESLKGNDYFDALIKRMASGKGNDVFMVNHDVLLELEQKEQVADLSQLSNISSYTEQMRSQMEEKSGKIYWVPTTVSAFGLYCNMDLLKKYGQKVPQNIGEWDSVCSFFKQQGITPVVANNDISLKTMAIGHSFFSVYQENSQADIFDKINRGEARLSDYLRSGFSIAESFLSKGYIDREKALHTKKTSDDLEEFAKGEAPFMLTGAWAAGRVENMNTELDFEVAPLPVLEDGSMLVINPDTRLSVNADSQHLEAAMKFVEYFTEENNIQKFADQQSSFSPLKAGSPSSIGEIQSLVSCYKSGRTVIGSDALLELPIWELTAEAAQKLLSGERLETVMEWIDQQAGGDNAL